MFDKVGEEKRKNFFKETEKQKAEAHCKKRKLKEFVTYAKETGSAIIRFG